VKSVRKGVMYPVLEQSPNTVPSRPNLTQLTGSYYVCQLNNKKLSYCCRVAHKSGTYITCLTSFKLLDSY